MVESASPPIHKLESYLQLRFNSEEELRSFSKALESLHPSSSSRGAEAGDDAAQCRFSLLE